MKRAIVLSFAVVLLLTLAAVALAQDPLKAAPQSFTEKLNNEHVRVLAYHSKPGDKEAMHSHAAGVVYLATDCKLKFTMPDGKTTEMDGKAGQTMWRDATTHAVENIGKTECNGLLFEPKEPMKK